MLLTRAPRLKASPDGLNAPPSIHQAHLSLGAGAGGGALVRVGLDRSAAPALGVAATSAYDGRAGEEGDPKPVAAMVHFIHPSGESISTIACTL